MRNSARWSVGPKQIFNLVQLLFEPAVTAVQTTCMCVMPWGAYHTCLAPVLTCMQVVFLDDVLLAHHLEPAEGPGTTGLIELCLSLPATTTSALIRIDFQKAFLTVFDHPPDAHRGFDIPAALLTFLHALPEHQVSTFTDTFAGGLSSRHVLVL